MAKDMAGRYLRRMPLLYERGLTVLGNLLGDTDVTITPARLKELSGKVDAAQRKLRVSNTQRSGFAGQIDVYWKKNPPIPQDLAMAMLLVMMHRYDVRRLRTAPSLFANEDGDPLEDETAVVVAANDAVYEAALPAFPPLRPAVLLRNRRCLRRQLGECRTVPTAGRGTRRSSCRSIPRAKPPTLSPATQHRQLQQRSEKIIDAWNFPNDELVRRVVNEIATRCLAKSLEPNGAVIANAFGILQSQFDNLAITHPDVARVLQFAVAYNAITLVPHRSCKNKEWCLLELGGIVLLKYGLTLERGGFIEGNADDIAGFVKGASS